jgi:hypothetical protein
LLVYHQLGMGKQCHLGSRQQTIFFVWCSCADRARRLAEAGADGFCGGVPTRPPRWFTGPVSAERFNETTGAPVNWRNRSKDDFTRGNIQLI